MTVSTPQPSPPAWQEEALPLPGPGTPVPAAPPPASTEPTTAMPAFLGADGKPLRPAKPAPRHGSPTWSASYSTTWPPPPTRAWVGPWCGARAGGSTPRPPCASRPCGTRGKCYACSRAARPRGGYSTTTPICEHCSTPTVDLFTAATRPTPPRSGFDRNPATGLALRPVLPPGRSLRCPTNRSTTTSASLRLMLSLTCMASWTASRGSPWPPAMR